MKMFFSVAANEDFELRKIDIRAAFLQAKQLDRDVVFKASKGYKERRNDMETKEAVIWFE